MKLKEILAENSSYNLINEAGLSRLFSGITDGDKKRDFCVMSAFRGNLTLKQNRQRNKDIYSILATYKIGGYPLIGRWQEAPEGEDWETTPEEDKIPVREESIWFYRSDAMSLQDFIDMCVSLCNKFNQDVVIIGIASEEEDSGIYFYSKDGSRKKFASTIKIRPEKLGSAYSILRGHPSNTFVFEGTAQPVNIIGNMSFKNDNMLWFSE